MKSDSFKEFFHKKQEQIKNNQIRLMTEMSLKIDSDVSILTKNAFDPKVIQYYIDNGDFIETTQLGNNRYDVYKYRDFLIFFSSDPYIAAMVEYIENENNSIKLCSIERTTGFTNLMEYIFVDYLLNRYDRIESDNVHTQKGFWFYQKLAGMKNIHNTYEFFIKGPNGEKIVNDPKDMETTYGYDQDNLGYTYVLKRK